MGARAAVGAGSTPLLPLLSLVPSAAVHRWHGSGCATPAAAHNLPHWHAAQDASHLPHDGSLGIRCGMHAATDCAAARRHAWAAPPLPQAHLVCTHPTGRRSCRCRPPGRCSSRMGGHWHLVAAATRTADLAGAAGVAAAAGGWQAPLDGRRTVRRRLQQLRSNGNYLSWARESARPSSSAANTVPRRDMATCAAGLREHCDQPKRENCGQGARGSMVAAAMRAA